MLCEERGKRTCLTQKGVLEAFFRPEKEGPAPQISGSDDGFLRHIFTILF